MPDSIIKSKPLSAEQVSQAYPLIQTFYPGLSLDVWAEYAMALTDNPGAAEAGAGDEAGSGIMTAQNTQGHILGLAAYRLLHELRCMPNFEIENFIAPNMPGQKRVVRNLIKTLQALAQEHGSSCMSVRVPVAYTRPRARPHPLIQVMEDEGFQTVAVHMWKPLLDVK
tara:strand:+ start:1164 stop:1667 length:504 start_codon:yes stop_codon:yes gene_type:complete